MLADPEVQGMILIVIDAQNTRTFKQTAGLSVNGDSGEPANICWEAIND